jgi:hypothetical protein
MSARALDAIVWATPTKEARMSTMTAPSLHLPVETLEPRPQLAAVPDLPFDEAPELRRWLLLLTPPFVLSGVFFAAAVATGVQWLIGPAIAVGPMLLILMFIYLGLSSDTEKP